MLRTEKWKNEERIGSFFHGDHMNWLRISRWLKAVFATFWLKRTPPGIFFFVYSILYLATQLITPVRSIRMWQSFNLFNLSKKTPPMPRGGVSKCNRHVFDSFEPTNNYNILFTPRIFLCLIGVRILWNAFYSNFYKYMQMVAYFVYARKVSVTQCRYLN